VRSLHVLVAEDPPVNQRNTTRFLDKLGATWKLAANGQEALDAFKQFEFDVLLMDVQMPVMDGLETTLAIRKLEALRGTHVPIIALTANVLEEHRREAQVAGFDDYLAKPVGLEELRTRLNKWAPRDERAPDAPAQPAEVSAPVQQPASAG
jgi:CheY-like chemotaxis protein